MAGIIEKIGKSIDSGKASYIDLNNSSLFSLEKRRKVFISSSKTLLDQLVIMIK